MRIITERQRQSCLLKCYPAPHWASYYHVLCITGPTRAELLVQKARKAADEGIIADEDPLLAVSPLPFSDAAAAASPAQHVASKRDTARLQSDGRRVENTISVQVESQRRPSARPQRPFEHTLQRSLPASSRGSTSSADTVSALMQQRFDEHPKGFTDKQCK